MNDRMRNLKKIILGFFAAFLGGKDIAVAIELPEITDEHLKNQKIIPERCRLEDAGTRESYFKLTLPYTGLPQESWKHITLLSGLADEIFRNPEVSRLFAKDPAGYLESLGLKGDELDPETIEVKIILSLGNERVREAIKSNKPDAFVNALEELGLLDYKNIRVSSLLSKTRAEILSDPTIRRTLEELGINEAQLIENEKAIFPAITVAYLIALVVSQAGVAYNVVAWVNATTTATVAVDEYAWANTTARVYGDDESERNALNLPPFMLARFMGGSRFSEEAFQQYLDKCTDSLMNAVYALAAKNGTAVTLDDSRMRSFFRKQIQKQLENK